MSLLSRLEAKGTVYKHERLDGQRFHQETRSRNAWIRMRKKLEDTHVLDHSGEYQVLDNFLKAGDTDDTNIVSDVRDKLQYFNVDTNGFDVSVVTQSSSQNLHHLSDLARIWQGPVSVSVFTFGEDISNCLLTLAYLHLCDEHVKKYVTFHLVYPLSHPPKNFNFSHLSSEGLCEHDMASISSVTEKNYAISGLKYPHNLLRNLAIKYTLTSYVLMLDIDILPSGSLRKNFYNFIQKFTASNDSESEPTAFVLPVFEVEAKSSAPHTKPELLSAWRAKTARPFYSEVCWKCQRHTNYERWRTDASAGDSPLQVAYYLYWKDPWEPFYITKRNLPSYDERFKQYGFNRISQVSIDTKALLIAMIPSCVLSTHPNTLPCLITRHMCMQSNRIHNGRPYRLYDTFPGFHLVIHDRKRQRMSLALTYLSIECF